MRAASAVDGITDYGFYYFVAPLVSVVDTVRATQMHVNTDFCSSPHLLVSEMTHTCETMSKGHSLSGNQKTLGWIDSQPKMLKVVEQQRPVSDKLPF